MTLNSRLVELKRKHMSLSQAVELAQKYPAPDQFRVAELKKKKLLLIRIKYYRTPIVLLMLQNIIYFLKMQRCRMEVLH